MGNSKSTKKDPETIQGGPLDSKNRLETLYQQILDLDEVKSDLKQVFRDLRILVIGRSGSGKTTLIRLVVGGKGPQTISDGRAGEQDISVEWHHPDPELPLIFHDSNGTDVTGRDRLSVVKEFLDAHQNSRDFSQKIHLVWYVFSGADTRFLDDGGLMELLNNYNIPLLLVMTFNDIDALVKRNVTKSNLETLLGRIKDVQRREKAQQEMVKIGNNIQLQDNELIGTKDVNGLKNLIERTKELIGKKLHYTWIACQAIDVEHKLEASASLIVRYKKAQVFSTFAVGAMPVVLQVQLAYMFAKVLTCLCKIWNVPPNLKKAMFQEFYVEEGRHCILRNLFRNMAAGLGLAISVGASVLTAGAATPAIIAIVAAAGFSQLKGSPVLLMSYSFLILGVILYVKSIQITKEQWDADKSVEQYKKYCEEFASSDYPITLKSFAQQSLSAWETTIRTKHQKQRVKGQIIGFFKQVMLNRRNSLFNILQQTADQEAHGAPWSDGTGESSNMQEAHGAPWSDGTGESSNMQPDQGTDRGMMDYQNSECL